jgi:hypothetical protein
MVELTLANGTGTIGVGITDGYRAGAILRNADAVEQLCRCRRGVGKEHYAEH